jgi:pyruvate kinase
MIRRAKIVVTLGPATHTIDQIRQLVEAGMDVARLNMSHGTHEEHARTFDHLRQVSQQKQKSIGILLDLCGPKIRTGETINDMPIQIKSGTKLILTSKPVLGSPSRIHVNHSYLSKDLQVGDRVLIDDGRIELHVTKIQDEEIETEVINGGLLGSKKGVNFPGVTLSAPSLTPKDRKDLTFGLKLGVDAIALSFVRNPDNIETLKQTILEIDPDQGPIPIIAKLERPEALDHLDDILDQADGVMVARGDLGVEVSPEKVPSIQKDIIQQAIMKRKITITATQMLESMIQNPRPTRAEASDVANAIFDGSDALMLSGETAIGQYPIEAVQTMKRIIIDAESHAKEWGLRRPPSNTTEIDEDAIATTLAAHELAQDRKTQAIAVFTRSGRTARFMSNARPSVPILAFTPEEVTYYQMAFLWGVQPKWVSMAHSVEEMIQHVEKELVSSGQVPSGEQVVLVASLPIGAMGPANFTLLHTIH